MTRTKWMRLLVCDLSDVVRWASRQNARQIDSFRYRVVNGRESVSFRLVPKYPIEVGTRDIVVICHVRASAWRLFAARTVGASKTVRTAVRAAIHVAIGARSGAKRGVDGAAPADFVPGRAGELRTLPWVRTTSPSAP